ncbi:hypothetical protein [Mycolicibacterium madagascariense]|nr:hypothetical protein [Mycolicibacterium madagascariense]
MGRARGVAGALVSAVVLVVSAGTGLGSAEPAAVSPDDGAGEAVAPQLSLTSVGSDSTLAFFGAEGTASVTIPVPPGLVPASIDAVLEIPVNMASGVMTVTQDDRVLSRVDLPVVDRTPVSIPLAGASIVDNAVTVVLRTYLAPTDGYCFEPTNPLRLAESSVRYDGVEAPPQVVADFLPPVLQQLDVYLPERPSRTETDAAVRLATAVVARYGTQRPNVVVLPLPAGATAPPVASLPLQRQVVIREDPGTGVTLLPGNGVPALAITGPAGELTNQARMVSSNLGRLAISSKAVAGPLRSSAQLPPDDTTIRQLGQPGVNATALTPQVSIALDQTRLGRSAHDVRVRLRGSYTPLPASVGGQLVAAIAGQTVDRWPADPSGAIDRWVDVPDRLLQRYTNLGVAMQISGNTGHCGDFQPVTLTIDGDTAVQSVRSTPPLPGGFQSLPQALMPRLEIGVEDGFDDARRAVNILVALQRLSALPIDTAVTNLSDAAASANPAVLVSAGGWTNPRLKLPVSVDANARLTVGNPDGTGDPGTLTLDPAMAFGSLQTVLDGDRTVLVATSNGNPGRLDALLDWVNADTARWSQVKGSALIAATGHDPVAFGAGDPLPPQAAASSGHRGVLYGAAAAALATLVAVGAIVVLRRRRRPA